MKLAAKADRIAARLRNQCPDAAAIRDACDIATGSDLSPSLLDRLAEMVARRLSHEAAI